MKHSIIRSIAVLIIFFGSFLLLPKASYAEAANQCCAGNGACCTCDGPCGANATQCWCK